MSDADDIFAFLDNQMADHDTTWSLGTFGAIAEFARDPDEPVALRRGDAVLAAVTARGAIRIEAGAGMRLFASESITRESWNQRVAVCLPEGRCAMNRRTVLIPLGPDLDALRQQDRDSPLFDLGLGALQVDLCVRVGDSSVAAQLMSYAVRPLFEPGNPAMSMILDANPHRVFVSRVGRIEVFQPIPPADGKSPDGPHTHVLPKLLHHRRTHPATEPVPDGFIPCAHLYPAHPATDALGQRRRFDRTRYDAFQKMLRDFGDPEFYAVKQRVVAAVAAGEDPSVIAIADGRFMRTNIRVALRQLKAADDVSPSLTKWLAAHERSDQIAAEDHAAE